MTEEEIKKMQAENATLKTQVETLTKDNGEFKESNTKLGEDLKAKDTEIGTLKTQAGERAEQFKRFKDMTDAEKDLLTEKEKELMQRQDKFEEEQAQFRKETEDRNKKERDARIETLATKMAKGDADLKAQIKINLTKLNPEALSKAQTEEELTPYIQDALNMTGAGAPADPLRSAHNTEGAHAPIKREGDFADTSTGKELAGALNLSQATPEGQKAVEGAVSGTQ